MELSVNTPLILSKPAWLEDAIIYQIYPQSFYDSNDDGIGDIPGIIEKLDYIESLGVNACWLNPCFESPFQDAGYDVADYYKVAERYGSNDDLKRLFDEAHRRNMRILLDLVPGHTSILHPWFQESSRPDNNQYTDYYIWTDSAWKWDVPNFRAVSGFSQRDGSYITNFFYFQPALNYGFAHPDPAIPWQQPTDAPGPKQVRQELKDIILFWLDLGADGFRVDMAFSLVKADPGHRETIKFWQDIRSWLDKEYPEAVLISEWGVPSLAIQAGFHVDFCLPFATPGYTALFRKPYGNAPGNDPYGFSFFDSHGHGNITEFLDGYLQHYERTKGKGHISIISGNHDINPRLSKGRTTADMELAFLFILTMPGVPGIWFGDEIGMRTLEELHSKEGGYNRTASRTPMQWTDGNNAGFSNAPADKLYLPIDPDPDRPTVSRQDSDLNSLLNRVRRINSIRKTHTALQASASLDILYAQPGEYPLVFLREDDNESMLVAINPSSQPVQVKIPSRSSVLPQTIYGQEDAIRSEGNQWIINLTGVSGGIYRIAKA
jgi:glycosidase